MKNKQEKNSNGITLVALIVTIIVLLILAGISIATLTGENGTVNNAQKAKFKTNVAKYKEQIALNSLVLEDDNSIKGLKQQLELQKGSLEQAYQNCEEGINLIMVAEGNLTELHGILQGINEDVINYSNLDGTEQNKEELKQNISSKINDWDEIISDTKFENRLLLDGSINENNPYIINFGSSYFEQGSIKITINNLHWQKLYGKEEIDYNNIEDEIEKIDKVESSISAERGKLGGKQNVAEYAKQWVENQKTSLETLYQNIFGANNEEISEEQAIKNAKSWKTTINFIRDSKKYC